MWLGQVMDCALPSMRKGSGTNVHRARFSAITAPEIKQAMVREREGHGACCATPRHAGWCRAALRCLAGHAVAWQGAGGQEHIA